ncbi:MAG TPA: aminoglycoside phosphotransferase family protein [Bacteroidales bacterium]|nr:aminoglycoside phosphotransferase family protein [Bacteroidales bacterium]HPT11920.1 aminoglycoside phosphotransferase family protein [Bacteroidales bacterium]
MEDRLEKIFNLFDAKGTYLSGESYGSGHIHDTYRILTAEDDCDNYIIQKLNTRVFRDIPRLQNNIERVTEHLRHKLSLIPDCNVKRECLTLIPLRNSNLTFYCDEEGNYWRMYIFISDHKSYDIVDTPNKAYEGGKAIGRFQAMLADLDGEPLFETIPFFHNIEKRLETFHGTVTSDPKGRASEARDIIKEIESREEKMKTILRLGEKGLIPLRTTHNDTKFNNILLDMNDTALCVIDLDTVMPGYVHYDFGDAIRTATNTAAEDERDLDRIKMDISLFAAYAEGYLSQTRETLNAPEIEYLALAPQVITYTIATRFITDFIDGDNYFKIKHSLHNLQRARAQMKLLQSMEDQYSEMQKIIKKLSI